VIASTLKSLAALPGDCLRQAIRTCLPLFRIIVPIAIGVRLLEMTGAIALLGQLLAPVMTVVGLPGSMGLVWATTLVTNIYGGMVVFQRKFFCDKKILFRQKIKLTLLMKHAQW